MGNEGYKPHLERAYFAARVLEIGAVLSYLNAIGQLTEQALDGPIFDLATGSGVGLTALRRVAPQAELTGVDSEQYYQDQRGNDYSGGEYRIPNKAIVAAAGANFTRKDLRSFLQWRRTASIGFLTCFYIDRRSLATVAASLFKEAGRVLRPGGQLLITSDADMVPVQKRWMRDVFHLQGSTGPHNATLLLPDYGVLATHREELALAGLEYLESETVRSGSQELGLIRDRSIVLATKRRGLFHSLFARS